MGGDPAGGSSISIGAGFWRHRRYILLAIGLWLLGQLAAGPSPYPWLLVDTALGLGAVSAIAALASRLRYLSISILIAMVPVRMNHDTLVFLLGEVMPVDDPLWRWPALALVTLTISRLVAGFGLVLDQLALRHPWFIEARTVIQRPRREVWRALCLTEDSNHWNPTVERILQDMRFPTRYIIRFDGGPTRLVLREVDREEEMFQELETEADPGFCHGLGPVISVLLEDVPRGTRVTMGMELHGASLLRLGRLFLDADLTWYLQSFARAMSARPQRPLIPGPRIEPLQGSERRPAAIHG